MPTASRRPGRLRTLALLVLAPLALLAGGACSPPGPVERARHVLFVTVDTLRCDRLGCYGGPNPTSPNIDRLAAAGTRCATATTSRAVTLPSMATFFTSKYPSEHGVFDNTLKLGDDEWTLAERLQGRGFRTRCFNASAVLMPGRGNIEQGFDTYDMVPDEYVMTQRAARFLREGFGKHDKRDFLWVHYMNPHKPYDPPVPYATRFTDPAYVGRFDAAAGTLDRIYVEQIDLAPAERAHVEAVYDGTVAFVDACVGELLAALDASGVAEDTLVVFSADHGEDLYSHNRYFYHANSVYLSSTRIPLIFRQPDAVPPAVVLEGAVENVDFMPTVLEWLGVGLTDDLRGLDLGPALRGEDRVGRAAAFAQYQDSIFVARDARWTFVSNPEGVHPDFPPKERAYPIAERELYDLATDPDEQVNLLARAEPPLPEQVAAMERLEGEMTRWLDRLVRRDAESGLTDEWRRVMEEQGYLGKADDARPARRRDLPDDGKRER